jgi:hypothetical protein
MSCCMCAGACSHTGPCSLCTQHGGGLTPAVPPFWQPGPSPIHTPTYVPQGWQCPVCRSVYAPTQGHCTACYNPPPPKVTFSVGTESPTVEIPVDVNPFLKKDQWYLNSKPNGILIAGNMGDDIDSPCDSPNMSERKPGEWYLEDKGKVVYVPAKLRGDADVREGKEE